MSPDVRMYRDEQDLERMKALVAALWAARAPHVECTAGDLDWRMFRFSTVEPARDVALCEGAGGRLLGFAWWLPGASYADLLVGAGADEAAAAAALIAWVEARAGAQPAGGGDPPPPPTLWALESNAGLNAALERAGYARDAGCYFHLARPLDGDLPAPAPPPGFTVRAVAGPEDLEARVGVHRRAFGSTRVSTESYARIMRAGGYRRDLDLVVATSEGGFGAFALVWLDAASATGELEPVGTDPAFQRRGLARAAIAEALRRLRALGARRALVYSLASNPASTALYESAGFRRFDRNLGWVKVSGCPMRRSRSEREASPVREGIVEREPTHGEGRGAVSVR